MRMIRGLRSSFLPTVRTLVGITLLATAGLIAGTGTTLAQGVGDLAVAPTRIVLEGRTRSAQISLLNRGNASAIYRITIINMQMTENGEYKRVETSGVEDGHADTLVRHAPRQVELQPGKAQTVRILLRKPANLPDGEYRSHILFQAVPNPGTGQSIEMATNNEGLSIRLVVVPGITIPLIVRQGELVATASISEVGLSKAGGATSGPALSLRINRSGARSVFGDIAATYITPTGSEYVVAEISQLAVYTPNASRRIILALRVPDDVTLNGGKLRIEYRTRPEDGGKTIASALIKVP